MTVVAEFVVHGEPVPKARARTVSGKNSKPHTYTPEATKNAEREVLRAWMRAGISHRPHKEDRYKVTLAFHRGTKRACDIDNLAKTVLDALNGFAWLDDSQVAYLSVGKLPADADGPRTTVRIERIEQEAVA